MQLARILVLTVGLLATTGSALGQTDEAKRAFDEGMRAFRAQRYVEAAEAYERSARASPHAASLVNAADSWERDGNLVRAARACDRALTLLLEADERKAIEARRARLLRGVGTLAVTADGPLAARLDGGELFDLPATIRVSPGRHRLVSFAPGTAREGDPREIDVAAGETMTVALSSGDALASVAMSAATTADVRGRAGDRAHRPPVATWLAFGIAAAAIVPAAAFSVMTIASKDDYESNPTERTQDAFYRNRLLANVSFGMAGAAAIAGGVLWLTLPRSTRAAVGPAAHGAAGLRLRVVF